MNTMDAIFARRSVRLYKSEPIPDDVLEDILEAGLYAPSAVDLQPWFFVAVKSEEAMQRLLQIMARVSEKMRPVLEARFVRNPEVVQDTTRFLLQLGGAPVCVLAFQYKSDYKKTMESIVESVSAAIENMLIAATEKGLGSCWLTAPLETGTAEELRQAFAPNNGRLLALVTLGYAEKTPKAPARKTGRWVVV